MGRNRQIAKQPDLWSGLFFLVLGGVVCGSSVSIDLGTLVKPGPGFIPFLAGLVLMVLSMALMVRVMKSREWENWAIKIRWGKTVAILISLWAFGFLLEWIGFAFITFLFVAFCMRAIKPQSWMKVLTVSLLTTAASYLLFETFLQSQLPKSFLGIF